MLNDIFEALRIVGSWYFPFLIHKDALQSLCKSKGNRRNSGSWQTAVAAGGTGIKSVCDESIFFNSWRVSDGEKLQFLFWCH